MVLSTPADAHFANGAPRPLIHQVAYYANEVAKRWGMGLTVGFACPLVAFWLSALATCFVCWLAITTEAVPQLPSQHLHMLA
jgi:hypothetical protein